MHKIGDMLKLHIDGADMWVGGLWKARGYPKLGGRIKAGGRSSLHTISYMFIRDKLPYYFNICEMMQHLLSGATSSVTQIGMCLHDSLSGLRWGNLHLLLSVT